MTSPRHVIFESNPALIKRSGDNSGYIYSPAGLIYLGDTFDILPGEPIMVIPHQPDNFGPWKQYRTIFENGRLLKCREEEILTIMIQNRFPNQIFKVSKGCSLVDIIDRWGINHEMCFVLDHQMEKIEAYELITLDESDDDDDDDNKVEIEPKFQSSKKCCCHSPL
jgi:hypothetical protein